jgi:hypothetical protein
MALLGGEYKRDEMPQSQFGPIDGWRHVVITEAEVKDTKAGDGRYLKLRLDILGPTDQGRVGWANITIRNPSSKAEEIGRQQLGDVMRAVGIATLTDTDQLINKHASVKFVSKDDPNYGPSNEVKGWKPVQETVTTKPAQASAVTSKPRVAGVNQPPWKKKVAAPTPQPEPEAPTPSDDDLTF